MVFIRYEGPSDHLQLADGSVVDEGKVAEVSSDEAKELEEQLQGEDFSSATKADLEEEKEPEVAPEVIEYYEKLAYETSLAQGAGTYEEYMEAIGRPVVTEGAQPTPEDFDAETGPIPAEVLAAAGQTPDPEPEPEPEPEPDTPPSDDE